MVPRKVSAAMESLMAGDVNVNAVTPTGMTPLISAAADGHLGTVRALIKRGAAVNQKRHDGFTALSLAAFFGHEQIVRELLIYGADIKAQDRSRTTAEMWADARSLTTISDLLREIRERSAEMASPESVPASEPILAQPSPQPLTTVKDVEDLNKTTTIRQRTETVEAKVVADVWDEARFPEGIRRVGSVRPATPSNMFTLEDRVENVAAFSPFSALVDRLAVSWKQMAIVTLVVMLLSGVISFAAVKAIVRKAKPNPVRAIETTSVPVKSEQPASLPNQPAASLPEEQTRTSLEVSTGQGADAAQRQSPEDTATQQANHSSAAVLPDLKNGTSTDSETKPSTEKAKSRYSKRLVSEVARSPHTTRRRSESTSSDGDVRNGSTRANEPAAIKIVSELPAKQVRPASSSKEIQAQPTAPLEGSSTKRKVIQWP
jgi:Ankyrin repeats (3 copies)